MRNSNDPDYSEIRMGNKTPLIRLEKITKNYILESGETYKALDGVDLMIRDGEFVAIMGPSGSGKSTMMHIMGALDNPTGGRFFLRGRDISSYTEDQLAEIRNREIGFVFQSFNLLARTTVLKNVERPMMYAGVSPTERTRRAMEALTQVGIAEKANNLSNRISGGQIQRVAIARAIVMNPSLILADEPTGNLDSKTSHSIMQFLSGLNKQGRTIVVITHEEDIAAYAKRRIKLIDGRVSSDSIWNTKK
jgi:putative ABC transport system ATP-binding protein